MAACADELVMPSGLALICDRVPGHDDVLFDERPEGEDGPLEDAAALKEHKKALHTSGASAWGGIPGF